MIIFDLDGTLSIVGDRVKYLKPGEDLSEKDWDSFYEHCGEDKVNEPIAKLFNHLHGNGEEIKIITGRRESVRDKTLKWLWDNCMFIGGEDLHMRKNGDYRHDILVKPELAKGFLSEIEMVFEDRNSMVEMWRKLGITCLQVAEGDF